MALPLDALDALSISLGDRVRELHRQTPRARVRRVDSIDVAMLISQISMVRPEDDDVRLMARVYGGFVASSYPGRAECDVIDVAIDLRSGTVVKATVTRSESPTRSYGRGNRFVLRLAKEGQAKGRVI